MSERVAPMDVRLKAALADESVNVSAVCRDQGISRQTFYKWRGRFRAGGLDGLAELSRRPLSSPARTPVGTEEAILRWRKELVGAGLDAGPATIQWHLGRERPQRRVPSEATIYRILQRR